MVSNAARAFASIQPINLDTKEKQVHLAVMGNGDQLSVSKGGFRSGT